MGRKCCPKRQGYNPASVVIAGGALNVAADYRVTVNNFLAGGGDGFSVLTLGTNLLTGEIGLDALVTYFGANSPVLRDYRTGSPG